MRTILLLFLCFGLEALDYQRFQLSTFTTAHVLTVDPKVDALKLVAAPLRRTVPELVRQEGALAGINGGFFHENGAPSFLLKIENQWIKNKSVSLAALGFSKGGEKVLIDQVYPVWRRGGSGEWDAMENIVGGTPLLVKDGEVVRSHLDALVSKPFYYKRHPRTAVGVRENGEWVLVVIDGRVWNFFGGMSIPELARLMKKLGCERALNLDGGGSSIMVVGGQVVSTPAEGDARKGRAVKDALLVLPREENN